MRDDNGVVSPEKRELLKKELGDLGWYISALATELGLSMQDIFQHNIDKLFDEYIKNDMENFLSSELYALTIGGICEHCGLMRLSIKKEDGFLYLIAWCYKNSKENSTGKYKIAIINQNNELEYQEDELVKYYEES
jgi:hypothetical protein